MPLNLYVIVSSNVKSRMPPLDTLVETPLQDHFSSATNGRLELNIIMRTEQFQSVGCTSAILHEVVHRYIPENPGFPANDIALVFADSWHSNRTGLFGLMFDRDGYESAINEQMNSGSVHRQACAVFLNAFTEPNKAESIIHTAIHELGHVFNLLHDHDNNSFMGEDTLTATFTWSDLKKLEKAADGDWYYAPGGANFATHESSGRSYRSGGLNPYLTLNAGVEKNNFLLGEPVALDLELINESKQTVQVRPELDPGYPSCTIWYVNPLGERRLFRPRMNFCRSHKKRVPLYNNRSLTNNPRISHGQIGTEFTIPGDYIAWAEFDTGLDDEAPMVISNKVKFSIIKPKDEVTFDISSGLMSPIISSFTINKGGVNDSKVLSYIESFVKQYHEHDEVGHLRYALARYYAEREDYSKAADCLCDLNLPKGLESRGLMSLTRLLKKKHCAIQHTYKGS